MKIRIIPLVLKKILNRVQDDDKNQVQDDIPPVIPGSDPESEILNQVQDDEDNYLILTFLH